LAELSRSRELDPSQARTVGYLGLAHARAGQYGEAYAAFLRAEQPALAREMEQYLPVEERQAIRAGLLALEEARRADGAAPSMAEAPTEDVPSMGAAVETEGRGVADRAAPTGSLEVTDEPRTVVLVADAADDESGEAAADRDADEFASEGAAHGDPGVPGFAEGMITQAVAVAGPSSTAAAARVARGHHGARPVGAWATERLIRPDDGSGALELS